ncbi:hypothetical protein MADA3029_470032 [Vibrio nigripulchritudo MADA3029]|nr:hypothetical protein VIBNIMADA3020_1140064 [Vibrio nigripulchritudo MADA3020]CCN56018.1 hypothetical protein VIBNIMADA3021_860014 [Vibrio nigripulchritudo MADA3021]CCN59760.1 hypothetical protein MADA3029_470032 [Vibrio nigripulchritudo MADA3029]
MPFQYLHINGLYIYMYYLQSVVLLFNGISHAIFVSKYF